MDANQGENVGMSMSTHLVGLIRTAIPISSAIQQMLNQAQLSAVFHVKDGKKKVSASSEDWISPPSLEILV